MSARTRAVLAGWATGDRLFSGVNALARSADPLPRIARLPAVRRGLSLAALGELAADKLPQAPARTEPLGFIPRLAFAAVCGAVLGRREETVVAGSAAALLSAAVASYAGPPARAALARRLGSDLPGALAEDATAFALAFLAFRGRAS